MAVGAGVDDADTERIIEPEQALNPSFMARTIMREKSRCLTSQVS
jgi:hypothetical protein